MTNNIKAQSDTNLFDFSNKKISAYILNNVVQKLKQIKIGDNIQIKIDNYKAIDNDLEAWSRLTKKKIELIESKTDYKIYRIEKTNDFQIDKKFAIIISDKGLEELLSPLGFAWIAAVSGMEVHIYFQGPAVKVLKKGFKEKLKGLSSIFSGFARNGLKKIGHLPPQDKLIELKKLGAKFYLCQPSMDHFKVRETDLIFDNIIIAEYGTFIEVLSEADIKFFLQ